MVGRRLFPFGSLFVFRCKLAVSFREGIFVICFSNIFLRGKISILFGKHLDTNRPTGKGKPKLSKKSEVPLMVQKSQTTTWNVENPATNEIFTISTG